MSGIDSRAASTRSYTVIPQEDRVSTNIYRIIYNNYGHLPNIKTPPQPCRIFCVLIQGAPKHHN